jgi:multiple sugar transport system substrate-binding protein
MKKGLTRRSFLQMSGAAAAAAALSGPLGRLPAFAQGAELSVQTWGHFITALNPLLESLTADWASKNDASIEWNYAGFDAMLQTISTAAATGAGPDIVMFQYDNAHQFAEALVDVSDVCEAVGEAYGGWYDVAREACQVDGVWRGMPWYFAAHGMVYREDLLNAAGYDKFPETYDELLTVGKALKDMGHPMGFALGRALGDGNNICYAVLWSFGGAVIDADGNIALDSPETRTALEYMRDLYNDAMVDTVVEWDDGTNNRAFIAGEVSCTNNASSIYWAGVNQGVSYGEDASFANVVNHAPYPLGPAGRQQILQIHSYGILNSSQNVEKAKELLSFINSDRVWQATGPLSTAFNLPLVHTIEEDPAMPWNFNPKLKAFKGLAATGHTFGYPGKASALTAEIANNFIITDMFARVAVGGSVDDAIETAIEAIEDIQNA